MKSFRWIALAFLLSLSVAAYAAEKPKKDTRAKKVEVVKNRNGQTEYRKEKTSNGYILRDRSGSVVVKAIYRGDKVYLYDRSGKLTNIISK
jgi:hypothetical protein